MRAAAALIALFSLAAPALAEQLPPEGTDWGGLLVSAIEANGCSMTEKDAPLLLTPHGFEQDWTIVVLEQLIEEGRATLSIVDDMPTVTVKTEACG